MAYQILPASNDYRNGGPQFDQHQFFRRAHAVSAVTQLSFQDYGRMHMQRHKSRERRLPTPAWVNNELQLQELIVRFLEHRFYINQPDTKATLTERLKTAEKAAQNYLPSRQRLLDTMLEQYVFVPKSKRAQFEVEIANLDTQIMLIKRGLASVIVSIIYLYYRMTWDSVQIADYLGVKPPSVRIILYRLNHLADGTSKWRPKRIKYTKTKRGVKMRLSKWPKGRER